MSIKYLRLIAKNNTGSITILGTLLTGAMEIIWWQNGGISSSFIFLSLVVLMTSGCQSYLVGVLAKEIVKLHEKIENLEKRIP